MRRKLAVRVLVAGATSAIVAASLTTPSIGTAAASVPPNDLRNAPRRSDDSQGTRTAPRALAATSKGLLTIGAPRRARAGKSIRIRGQLRPNQQGVRILLERSPGDGGGWTSIGSVKPNRASKYSFRTTALAGRYSYRAIAIQGKRNRHTSKTVTVRAHGQFVRAKIRSNVQTLSGRSAVAITGDPGGPRKVRLRKRAPLPRNGGLLVIKPGGPIRSGEAGRVSAVNRVRRSFALMPVPATDIYSDLAASFDTSLAKPRSTQALTKGARGRRSLSASAPEFSCNGTLSLDNRAFRVNLSSVHVQFAMDLGKKQLSVATTGKPSLFGGADALQGVSGSCSLFYPVTQKAIGYTGFVFRVGPVVKITVSASGRVKIGMRLEMPYTAGVGVDGSQISFTRGGRYALTPTVSVESEAGLSAGLAMQVELTWLRLAALQGTLGPEIKGTLKPKNVNEVCATVDGNVVTDLTANAARISKNWDFQIAGHNWQLGNFYNKCKASSTAPPGVPPVVPPTPTPTPTDTPARFSAMTAGMWHTCGLDPAGKAWCWGYDGLGQVGDGGADQSDRYNPVRVAGDHTFSMLTAGMGHTCGVDTAGKAWCWGDNESGELGTGDEGQAHAFIPVAVTGGHTFNTLEAGGDIHDGRTCGIDIAGDAWCWGDDTYGALGDGNDGQADEFSPVRVSGGHSFSLITTGLTVTCALDIESAGWCWGDDHVGQVGDGSADQGNKYSPVSVAGSHGYIALSAGGGHSCGIDIAGDTWCWGWDYNGAVGDGGPNENTTYRSSPVAVAGGHRFTRVAAGYLHTCAVDMSNQAWCWGLDRYGELGDGDDGQSDETSPVSVTGGLTFATLTTSFEHTCGVEISGNGWCWGDNNFGQLGNGSGGLSDHEYAPARVVGGL